MGSEETDVFPALEGAFHMETVRGPGPPGPATVSFDTNARREIRTAHHLGVTEELQDLIIRCLAVDPANRPNLRNLLTLCEAYRTSGPTAAVNVPRTLFFNPPDGTERA